MIPLLFHWYIFRVFLTAKIRNIWNNNICLNNVESHILYYDSCFVKNYFNRTINNFRSICLDFCLFKFYSWYRAFIIWWTRFTWMHYQNVEILVYGWKWNKPDENLLQFQFCTTITIVLLKWEWFFTNLRNPNDPIQLNKLVSNLFFKSILERPIFVNIKSFLK